MKRIIFFFLILIHIPLFASMMTTIKIPMYLSANHAAIGYVIATDTQYGLLLTPHLKSLPAGVHGFHIHEHPNCDHAAMVAGNHLDPVHTSKHLGPYNTNGHLGDLPALTVNADGTATLPVLAPRLKVMQLHQHALMIHVGGDNYADSPKPLGGGGERLACGVIP